MTHPVQVLWLAGVHVNAVQVLGVNVAGVQAPAVQVKGVDVHTPATQLPPWLPH